LELDPQECVIAEAGMINFMEDGITFEAHMGDSTIADQGFMSKMFSSGKRMLTGESLFMTHFTNHRAGKRQVAFAAPYPSTIIAVDLNQMGGSLLCQKDAFLAAARGTRVDIAFNRRLGSGFFGGKDFILQQLSGDGMVFIQAGALS
jgi:uncharacterized protein (AIM24 family)